MSRLGKYYLTTAISYPNDKPHLGHVLEVVGTDVQARFRRLIGHEVFFLTGTDEHGQKIPQTAAKQGIEPRELVNRHAPQFQELYKKLEISNDDFIRTTQERHHKAVQKFWQAAADNGYIYTGHYEGWYDTREENYITETELKARNQSTDDPFIRWMKEEAFFFKLSAFQDRIEQLFADNPEFCLPDFRAREMLGSFIRPGLNDLCISRSSIDWGIPVPGTPGHVVYVWFDALTNYLSGIGYGSDEGWTKWWPCDCHVIGKDILKFHTIIWPAMLMAAGIEPPKRVFGHGFMLIDKEKMSKSKGNVVDPYDLIDAYGVETLRFYLMRESNFGNDGEFDVGNLIKRYNDDLANGVGNLLSRSLTLIEKNLGGTIAGASTSAAESAEIRNLFESIVDGYEKAMPAFEYATALAKVFEGQAALDRYINDKKPWAMAKDPAQKEALTGVLYTMAEGLRMIASLICPFLPLTAEEMWRRLGMGRAIMEVEWPDHRKWGLLADGARVTKGAPMFPKLEMPAEEE
ncbi:MAG: methionine--tRNA ligase [Candidatus Sumerlaeia bacterium]